MTSVKGWIVLLSLVLVAGASRASEAIEEARYVRLGDIEQWITIRGRDRKMPVLLWVHGGPAEVQSPLLSAYEPWMNSYVLVHWDQRGAGRTYLRNPGPPDAMTLDRIAADGIELAEFLIDRLGTQQIILVGHSWGSLVAITMARLRPQLFETVIGTGQFSSWREIVTWQYEFALHEAREAHDEVAVRELEANGLAAA